MVNRRPMLRTRKSHLTALKPIANYFNRQFTNNQLLPSSDQHGFRPGYSTTYALLQLTSDIATGFKQRKPLHRTVCVAVDLTAEFDTVNHNVLLSTIVRSTLPEAICRWLSHYIKGRQSVSRCKGVKSKAMIVHTSVP